MVITSTDLDNGVVIGEYDIPEIHMAQFEKEIAALNKHAIRCGCAPATIERLGEEVRRIPIAWLVPEERIGVTRYADYLYIRVRVTGTAPKFDGWTLAATLEGTEAGTLVRTVPGVEIPTDYQQADPTLCEHCGKHRRRSATFVLQHEDGHCVQVGRQCLRDFLGGVDPQAIASLAETLFKVQSGGFGYGRGERVHETVEYLSYVVAAVREHGYLSASQARNGDGASTSGRASHQMRLDSKEIAREKWDEKWTTTPEDLVEAQAIMDEARAALAAVVTPNDYQHNLTVLLQLDYVKARNEGFVASVYGYVKRLHEQRAKRQAEEARAATRTNEWIGTVGKREVFTLRFMGYRAFQGDWGDRYLNRWEDATGNAVNWWTGTSDDYTEGAVYQVRATVKSHDEYKGRKQTIISRAAVTEV